MESGTRVGAFREWLLASRPRTLTLAVACVGMGLFLAAASGAFDALTATLTALTAALLQVLSNLANDYGDAIHGADHGLRAGPTRAVQSGRISAQQMRRAITIVALCAAVTGLSLLWLAIGAAGLLIIFVFALLGALAIWAAITYTAGTLPYGYAGLGDAAVLIFFGWIGVLGSYFLQTHQLQWEIALPASSCGLFAVGVLNVNNIRDIESDRMAGKRSLPVRFGLQWARSYHWALLLLGMLSAAIYVVVDYRSAWQWLFVISLPLFVLNGRAVASRPPPELDPYLGQLSVSTLVFVLFFGIGQLVAV